MFTLGIPLKQKRRTLGYLSNEYFPGGMKKLGQQVPYEILSSDDGFFELGFPGMDEDEFRDITFKLKQQGVTVIGADSQLTENNIMKLVNLVPLNEGRVSGPFDYKTLADIVYKDDSALAYVNGEHVALFSDGISPEDLEHFIALRKDGEEVVVMYDEVEFVETSTVDEGSCGYAPEGEDPNEADQPAGPHLLRKKIREMIKEKMKHPQYRDASNQYAQRGKSTRLSPEKKAAQKDRMKALAQRVKDLDKNKDIDEAYADDPDVPGTTGMEDAGGKVRDNILAAIPDSYGYQDLAQDIAYIIQNEYGSHNVKPFIQTLTQKLQRPNY